MKVPNDQRVLNARSCLRLVDYGFSDFPHVTGFPMLFTSCSAGKIDPKFAPAKAAFLEALKARSATLPVMGGQETK